MANIFWIMKSALTSHRLNKNWSFFPRDFRISLAIRLAATTWAGLDLPSILVVLLPFALLFREAS